MRLSLFELFNVGIGPSSSHTVGPMKAAKHFVQQLQTQKMIPALKTIQVDLYGSLALTGKGHGTDKALMLGLSGFVPETIDPAQVESIIKKGPPFKAEIKFNYNRRLEHHSNGMSFTAFDESAKELMQETYYSIGGGAIMTEKEITAPAQKTSSSKIPHPFKNAEELLKVAESKKQSIAEIMWANECAYAPNDLKGQNIRQKILALWQVMQDCVQRGLQAEGILPGGLKVKRRAKSIFQELKKSEGQSSPSADAHLRVMDYVNLYALAVNEENASGGKMVTAPTNGAAGIIPSVLHYYVNFCGGSEEGIIKFFLTAGAVGLLYKMNASISGAEVGCQGEIGVASSMAAAGLTEVLGGSIWQVENAAEIAMEHHLGLTCDPIGGLVQIPCIERNAMGAVKAINASRMAMLGDGKHYVSLDRVIQTMKQTGQDMNAKYKETSRGGLAVNVNIPEC